MNDLQLNKTIQELLIAGVGYVLHNSPSPNNGFYDMFGYEISEGRASGKGNQISCTCSIFMEVKHCYSFW